MKRLFVAIILFAIALGICACGCSDGYVSKYDENYKYDGKALVGLWQENEHDDQFYQTYEFFSDGKVVCTSYSFGIEMQHIDAEYSVDGDNTLVISWGNGYTDRNDFSITDDNILVLCQVIDSKTSEMELVPYNLEFNKSNEALLGSWASNDNKSEIFTFNQDYTGVVTNGSSTYSFEYSTKGSSLFFSNQIIEGFKEAVETVDYKVEGDILTLSGKDADNKEVILTFERVK